MRVHPFLFVASAVCACGGDESFPTFQECFTDHHVTENFTPTMAITICCLDHPIGSSGKNVVCGSDVTACTTYVTSNIMATDATSTEITNGCTDYITQRGM